MNKFFLHLAYVFLALPFVLTELLYIRYSLEMAFISLILWALVNGGKDTTTLIWNSIFLGINTFLIIIELRQFDWNPLPVNPLKQVGEIINVNAK